MKEKLSVVILLVVLGQAYYQLPLEGGILEKEYIVNLYIGTPPQPFKVMIDTGSGRLAINCKGCTNCDTHPNHPFNINKSSSATATTCSEPKYCINCQSDSPATERCESVLKYQDNSSNEGYVFTDRVSLYFDGITSAFSKVNCITSMSSQFSSDKLIDGIWGLAKNDIDVDNQQFRSDAFITELSSHFGATRTLAVCLGYEGGTMVFGGVDSAMHTQSPIIVPYDSPSADTISKSITQIQIGSTLIYSNAGQAMPDIIIDSGSTTSVLDRKTYNGIANTIKVVCASMSQQECYLDTQTSGSAVCVDLSKPDIIHRFPSISITIAGKHILWHPYNYLLLQNSNYPTYFCFDVMVTDTGVGSVLGADFMIGKDVVFGQTNIQIYPESYCGGRNFEQLIRSLLVSNSNVLKRKLSSSKMLIIMMAVIIPVAILTAIAVYCYWKRLRAKQEMNEELKIEGQAVIMGTPTDIRLKQGNQAVNAE